MNPIKLIRAFGKALRGGVTFREMFLAVFLGFAAGMIPGVNLTMAILIVLLLFLNTNGGLAALAVVLGKVLCLLLAPVTFQVGYAMMHSLGLVAVVRAAADTPVLALLDLQVYCLLGAIPFIIVIGVPLGWLAAKGMLKLQARISAAVEADQRLAKVSRNLLTRIVMRVVFGKQAVAAAKPSLFRKGRVIAAVVVVVVLAAVQFVFLDSLVKGGIEKALAAASGAEVNIAKADLSLASGRLVVEGLQVTDAANPDRNQVQAERIVSDVSIADLLARRFVVDLVEIQAMRTDAKRSSPGKVYRAAAPEKQEPAAAVTGDLLGKLGTSKDYYEEVKKFNDRLEKLRDFLKSEDTKAPEKKKLAEEAKATGYLALSAADYLTKRPAWVIREIRVSQIEARPDLPTFTAVGKNLSSHPSRLAEKMELTARPDEEALKAFLAKAAAGGGQKPALLGGDQGGQQNEGPLKGLLGK